MPARRRDERGVTAIVVAVLMSGVLLLAAAFAVDLGKQRVVRRDMQAVADVIALDLARQLDGRTKQALADSGTIDTAAKASLARNTTSFGDKPTVTWRLGTLDNAGGFVEVADAQAPSAVEVMARSSTSLSFAPAGGAGSTGSAARTAVARSEAGACFDVGTYAARVQLGDSTILGPLVEALGTDVGLGVLDWQGLAGADIRLLDLVDTDLVAGGFDALIGANVKLGDLYLAMADVLQRQGGHGAQVAVLQQLATVAAKDVSVRIADIVGIDSTNAAGLDAAVNVLDLVATAAFVANGTNAISVPDLDANVLGLSKLNANLKIGQRPISYCGRPRSPQSTGHTNQVEINLRGNLANLDLGVVSISAPIRLTLKLAPADVMLDAVACLPGEKRLDFLVTSGLVSLEVMLGDPANDSSLSVKALLGLLPLVDGHLRLSSSPAPVHSEARSLTVADDDYAGTPPLAFGDDSLGVPFLHQDSHLDVLALLPAGGLLGVVVTPLLDLVVNPLVSALDTALLTPLLRALGIRVAGAEVFARPRADCGIPALVG